MRILMISRFAPPHVGGVEKHIYEVSRVLRKKGYKIALLTQKDINYPQIPLLGLVFIWFWMFRRRRELAKYDLVHIHDVFIWYLPLCLLMPGKSVYVTFHGWEGKFPIPMRYKWVKQISARLAWGNICVGDYIAKWYGIKADYVTYGGVAKNQISHSKSRVQLKSKNYNVKLKILFIGRLEEDTGLPVYLGALHLIKQKHPKLSVEFLGDGSLRKEAEKYGKVHGFVSNSAPYLKKARFVFTSGYLSMLEAMAAGKLVFATYDNRLKKDYLNMSPFKNYAIMEKDPLTLAQRVAYYIQHEHDEKRRVKRIERWANTQTWDKAAELYLKLWRFL